VDIVIASRARVSGKNRFFAFLEDNQRVTYTYNVSADVIWLLSV
jgi:hypothetical protein